MAQLQIDKATGNLGDKRSILGGGFRAHGGALPGMGLGEVHPEGEEEPGGEQEGGDGGE